MSNYKSDASECNPRNRQRHRLYIVDTKGMERDYEKHLSWNCHELSHVKPSWCAGNYKASAKPDPSYRSTSGRRNEKKIQLGQAECFSRASVVRKHLFMFIYL